MANINEETLRNLHRLLSSWTVFYQKVHTYHWDLVGNNFNELHKFFEQLYKESVENADSVAERIRQVGERTALTLTRAVGDSAVSDDNSAATAQAMVADLITALAQLSSLQLEVYQLSDEDASDIVTPDLMVQLSRWTEFNSWFLSSWTGQPNESHS